jgi:two-component system OmpR family sensor kinase
LNAKKPIAAKYIGAFETISLRSKLTALSVALIGVLLLVSSVGTTAVLKTYLQQNQDTVLVSAAQVLRAEDPALIQDRLATGAVQLPNLPTDYYIAYTDAAGNLVLAFSSSTNGNHPTPNLSNFTMPNVIATKGLPFEVDMNGQFTEHNEGNGWRIVAQPLYAGYGSVVVALPTGKDNGLINQYRVIGLTFGLLLLLFSGIAVWYTITRTLRPLKEVERTAAAVAAGDISKRLMEHTGNTEIARINRSLNTMLSSIETAMVDRGKTLDQMQRFIADASHELRTPLVSVRGYAELYRMGALNDKQKLDDAMSRIESEAVRMTSLVESLLALARLEETEKLSKTKINLTEVAGQVAKDAVAASKGLKVELVALDGSPLGDSAVEAKLDLNAIKQVLVNLLSNAARFTDPKAGVQIALGKEKGKIILEVRDHGEGIPAELRKKVFERFYRADNSRNRETGGNGLGLSIVSVLVQRHEGTIEATETQGGGATFRVTLPA